MNEWQVRELIDRKIGAMGCQTVLITVILGFWIVLVIAAVEIIQPGVMRLAFDSVLAKFTFTP